MTNGEWNGLSSLPAWARATASVGFPVVVSLILLGLLYWSLTGPLARIAHIEASMREHVQQTNQQDQFRVRLLQQICRNTAKTELSLEACNR